MLGVSFNQQKDASIFSITLAQNLNATYSMIDTILESRYFSLSKTKKENVVLFDTLNNTFLDIHLTKGEYIG